MFLLYERRTSIDVLRTDTSTSQSQRQITSDLKSDGARSHSHLLKHTPSDSNEESMERVLHSGYTGIRSGETVVSSPHSKQNSGSEMVVRLPGEILAVPPASKYVSTLEYSAARDVLHEIPFFSKMTTPIAIEWLEDNKTKETYISDVEGIEVKFLSISGVDMERMPESVRSKLLRSNKFVPLSEVYDYFNKPGSKKNLIFRPSNWTIKVENDSTMFSGSLLTLTDQGVQMTDHEGPLANAVVIDDLAITYSSNSKKNAVYSDYIVPSGLTDVMKEASTPALHKSIIQKIIRTRTGTVSFLGQTISGRDALTSSIGLLMMHPGILNTNIHPPVFETGLQSALKRIAVSIAEDSYTDGQNLLFLLAAALYAKMNRAWVPSAEFLARCMSISVEAYEDIRSFQYDISADHEPKDNTYGLCLELLTLLGSLKTDLPMFASISHYNGRTSKPVNGPGRVTVTLAHAVDMHNITDIAWFVPREMISTYPDFFKEVWQRSSSANPRKGIYIKQDWFISNLLLAQTLALYLRSYAAVERTADEDSDPIEIEYTLHPSWFAAAVGPISIKLASGRSATVILNTSNMNDVHITIIPKLARGEKEYTVTEKDTEKTREYVDDLLYTGVQSGGRRLSVRDGIHYVDRMEWEEYSVQTSQIPVCLAIDKKVANAVLYSGRYIESEYLNSVDVLVASLSVSESSRVLMYLASYSSKINLRKIDRRGGSASYQVSPDDTSVFHFLCQLCVIAPCALALASSHFQVMDKIVFSSIREYILASLRSKTEESDWDRVDTSQTKLFPHQESALTQCILSYNGKSIINMTPGLGKTRIVIHYIAYLIERNLMTKYCIYTLPPSAMKGVVDQFLEYGIECNMLDYATSSKNYNADVLPDCVNFIKHDHMRLGSSSRRSFMEEARELVSSLFFVVDEFHLTLLDTTQRTSDAIELATSARYAIAMTGTMMHNKMELLVPWLKLICQFEVTSKNFLVAVGEVISSRAVTSVQIVREDVDIPLTPQQKKEHNSSFEAAVRLCYDLVNRKIVELAIKLIRGGTSVFVVAKDIASQEYIRDGLVSAGVRAIHLISSNNPVDYKPNTRPKLNAIITTARHSTGYTITGMSTMITSVYFSSQASREQLDMRLNRIGQTSKILTYITVHCGILTRVMERYDRIKSIADAMKMFASVVGEL